MKALSVRQPWAWAVARGHKDVENRSWTTAHRGPLLVHASMRVDLDACASPLIRDAGWDADDPVAAIGAIIAVVDVVDVCAASAGDPGADPDDDPGSGGGVACGCGTWAEPGAYHWRLANPRVLARPVLALGRLGLWEPADSLIAELPADLIH